MHMVYQSNVKSGKDRFPHKLQWNHHETNSNVVPLSQPNTLPCSHSPAPWAPLLPPTYQQVHNNKTCMCCLKMLGSQFRGTSYLAWLIQLFIMAMKEASLICYFIQLDFYPVILTSSSNFVFLIQFCIVRSRRAKYWLLEDKFDSFVGWENAKKHVHMHAHTHTQTHLYICVYKGYNGLSFMAVHFSLPDFTLDFIV